MNQSVFNKAFASLFRLSHLMCNFPLTLLSIIFYEKKFKLDEVYFSFELFIEFVYIGIIFSIDFRLFLFLTEKDDFFHL